MQLDHLLSLVPAMVRQNRLKGNRRKGAMAPDLEDGVVTDREARDVYGLDDGGGIREAGTPAARAKWNTRYAARVLVMSPTSFIGFTSMTANASQRGARVRTHSIA
jgi:hypothetical protein